MTRTRFILLALSAAISSARLGAQAARRIVIDSTPSCRQCRMSIEEVVTLREDTAFGTIKESMWLAPDRRGRWYATMGDRIAIFDSTGHFVRYFGRSGEGPGEFRGAAIPQIIGDTIFVWDRGLMRLSLFTLDGKYLRSIRISTVGDAMVLADRSIAMSNNGGTGPEPTFVTLLDRTGKALRTFAKRVPTPSERFLGQLVAEGNGGIWNAAPNEYRLELWDRKGHHRLDLVREVSWAPSYSLTKTRSPFAGGNPDPWLGSIWEDDQQRVWVVMKVADPDWKANLATMRSDTSDRYFKVQKSAEGSGMAATEEAYSMLYDTMVEVIDGRTGKLIHSRRFSEVMFTFAGGYLYRYREGADGSPEVVISKLTLRTDKTEKTDKKDRTGQYWPFHR